MNDHIYKIVEIAGSSKAGFQDAIEAAISRAAKTTRHLRWFEVMQMRGHIEEGQVQHYQVLLKAGFTLEEPD